MPKDCLSLFIAGDMLISRPWPEWQEPAFHDIVREMQAADVTVANLEAVIHEYLGYAQADSGGAWTAAPPAVAADLGRAGIDMLATANNHSFDYGPTGILETLEHLDASGIAAAGTGPDLQRAAAPCVIEARGKKVALLAMTATFHPYNRASPSRDDMRGRPGVNPLILTSGFAIRCPEQLFRRIEAMPKARHRRLTGGVKWKWLTWVSGDGFGFEWRRRVVPSCADRLLRSVAAAKRAADLVIVSVHSHNEREWLGRWCRSLIDSGADIVFVQGQHLVRGVELHRGKPIFHGLGDFVFQPHLIDPMPAETYENAGLPYDAPLADYLVIRNAGDANREAYEGAAAVIEWSGSRPRSIRLVPVDLQFAADPAQKGSPRRAGREAGRRIIGRIAQASRKLGATVTFDEDDVCGRVEIPCPAPG